MHMIDLIFLKKNSAINKTFKGYRISNKFNTENGCGICEFY